MNFLQLAQRLRQEAGVPGTGPTTVLSQTGELKRLVDWVATAWDEIQGEQTTWRWMRQSVTLNTVAGTNSYSLSAWGIASTFAYWYQRTFTIYRQSLGRSDERDLVWMDYDDWRRMYDFGAAASTQGQPTEFAIAPDDSIKLGFIPDAVYVVRADYHKAPTTLAADTDTPACPTQYHMAIVWKALMYYGEFESAPEAYGRGKNNYTTLMGQMRRTQLPRTLVGPPLV